MSGNANLDYAFNPKSVAIIGVSSNNANMNMAQSYLRALTQCKFNGPIYPINPKGGEIQGLKIYPNVKDAPGPVDYVICCIPAASVPQLIRDCAAKGVKVMQFFTSGFSETGTEEGRKLEAEIAELARRSGIRLIGPNCMGVYSPKAGLSFAADHPAEGGPVAFVCQSGGNATYVIRYAAQRGVRFSKVVSFGNAVDVDESDLLEYFTTDPETKLIAAYIEGVKDGRRFSKLLRQAAAVKPVILIKGGCTDTGARAVASHTGSLAGSAKVWGGLLEQAGVIPVSTLEELVDMLVTFVYLPVLRGRRIGCVGVGGGAAVLATDSYVSTGLNLPPFPVGIRQKLRSCLTTDAGLSLNNPVDLAGQYRTEAVYPIMKTVADYSGIDILAFHLPFGIMPPLATLPKEFSVGLLDTVIKVYNETAKPTVVVIEYLTTIQSWETAYSCLQKYREAKIPVYFSVRSAAKAIDRFLSYHERRDGSGG